MRSGGFSVPIRSARPGPAAALLLGASLGLGACAPPASSATGDALQPAGLGAPARAGLFVGCWAMIWDLGRGPEPDATVLPDSVSLRDGIVFRTGERLVSPATHPEGRDADDSGGPPTWESRYRLNRWWVEGDTLRVRFSDGARDEWLLWLGEDGDGLAGRGSAGTGAGPAAGVRAQPIACDFG